MSFCQPFPTDTSVALEDLNGRTGSSKRPEVPQGRKNPLWMGLPIRLRRIRKVAELSQRQLARLAGVSNGQVSLIEAGVNVPGVDLVEKLAAGLGVPPDWLAFGPEAALPFRQKQIQLTYTDPEPQPGIGRFLARHQGCGLRVREARHSQGLTLRAIGSKDAANLSYQAVQYTESGLTAPRVDTIEAIAVALDVPPGWLAYGEEPDQ